MPRAYLALGSNLGDRQGNLEAALAALAPRVEVLRRSPIYETEPWGVLDQPPFLNMVAEVMTRLKPRGLLRHLKDLELRLGRKPSMVNGPRLVDLDILFYANLVLDTPDLVIPHPRLAERAFVLVPLADLAPELCHPRLGRTVRELLQALGPGGIIRVYGENKGVSDATSEPE